jgi:arylsulfatase A
VGKWGQLPLNAADFKFDDYFEIAGSGAYWNTQKGKGTYVVNGEDKTLAKGVYLPDLMHEHAAGFLTRNKEKPFFLYYSLSHIHGEILPTPDSAKGSKDLVADNIAYMDKLVGKLLLTLDELKLRENTVLVFMGDNGSAGNRAEESTIGGRRLSGEKGAMLEGGAHVPLLISWPAKIKKPDTLDALVDISDFLPTFTDLAAIPRPANRILDGHSLAPLLLGESWKPREWVYNQLARMWWVREDRYKLDQAGDLWDMSGAPFTETKIPPDTKDPQAMAARARLEGILKSLAPEKGKLDDGNPTGRGKNKKKK